MKQGWAIRKISEVGRVFNGNSINEKVKKGNYTYIDKGVPFLATKDIGFDTTIDYNNGVRIPFNEKGVFKIAPKNTPLICAEGGSAGRKIGFTNQEVCFGNKLFAFVPDKGILGKFVFYYYFTPAFQENFLTGMAGIIGGVSLNKFKDIEIPIPPLSEQERIVSILDKAFAAIDRAKRNTEKNLQNVRELFESYLQGVFEKNNASWKNTLLSDLCVPSKVITYGVIKLGEEIENGVPCLRTSNVRWLNIDLTGIKRILPTLSNEYSRTILEGGEVLVNVRGTLGGVAVVPKTMKGWNVSREVAVIPIDSKKANPSYIASFIGSNDVQKWLSGVKKGAAYVGINIEDLRLLPVSLPNLQEQEKIIQKLEHLSTEVKRLEANYQAKVKDLEDLRKSILYSAFNGEFLRK